MRLTVSDVLTRTLLVSRALDWIFSIVEAERAVNVRSISDETGEDAVYDNHLADTATETYDRELDYSLEENSEHVLTEIDAALKRIADGTYGQCTNCGTQIPEERLEARPYATLCIECQRHREGR